MGSYPKSERDARARGRRKLKALKKRSWTLLHEIAGMFEEGQVSADIDNLLDDIARGVEAIGESMDDEVARAEERA